jgi:hypothetical protein
MASTIINPGFTGILNVGGTLIRCTSFGANTTQDAQFFNHVIGLNDTIPGNNATKGESVGSRQIQRYIWRPSVIGLGGSMSFPATEYHISTMFQEAKNGSYIPSLKYVYYCSSSGNNTIEFKECRVNGYDLSIQAGDILNITVDIAAKDAIESNSNAPSTTSEKFITWDKCAVTATGLTDIRGFSFKINNNIQVIYTNQASGSQSTYTSLLPYDLRIGMQEVTGTVSVYLQQGQRFIPSQLAQTSLVTFIAPGLTVSMNVVYFTSQLEGVVGPVVCDLPFTGVGMVFA